MDYVKAAFIFFVATGLDQLLQDEADGATRLWHLAKRIIVWYKQTEPLDRLRQLWYRTPN